MFFWLFLLILTPLPSSSLHLTSIAIGPTANQFSRYLTVSFAQTPKNVSLSLSLLTDAPPPPSHSADVSRIFFQHISPADLPLVPNKVTVKENKYQQVHWQWMDERKRHRLSIKSLKARLFSIVDVGGEGDAPLVFLDSDIVVSSNEGEWRAFTSLIRRISQGYRGAGRQGGVGPPAFACFRDIGNTGSPYHTGVLVLWPRTSEHILRLWEAAIISGDYPADQAALADLVADNNLDDDVAILDHTRYFAFLNGTVIRAEQPPLFTHMTTYRLSNPTLFHYTVDQLSTWLLTNFGITNFAIPD